METIKVIKERRAVRGFDPEKQLNDEDEIGRAHV